MNPSDVAAVFATLDRELWLVTSGAGDLRGGMIATFVAQASIVPEMPRVIVGIARQHHTCGVIDLACNFALHLLTEAQLPWVWRFGLESGHDVDKFAGLAYHVGKTGAPLIEGTLAWLDCIVESGMETGDRTVFLGRVVDGRRERSEAPLTARRMFELAPPEVRQRLRELMHRDQAVDARAIAEWSARWQRDKP